MGVRTVIGRVAATVGIMCVTAYLALLPVEKPPWWAGPWLLVVGVALGVTWVLLQLDIKPRRARPVMRMKRGLVGDTWEVENLTRKPLLDARYMGVGPDQGNLTEHYVSIGTPDFPAEGKSQMGSFPSGGYVAFHWIKDDLRRSARVPIRDGVDHMDVVPDPIPSRWRRRLP